MRRLGLRKALLLALLAIAVLSGLSLAEALRSGPLWRKAYPYLPRRAQALPYQIRSLLPVEGATPVALPTPIPAAVATVPREISASRPLATALEPREETIAATRRARPEPEDAANSELPRGPEASSEPSQPSTRPLDLPGSAFIEGVRHEYQTWNNCGPASISMALSTFGDDGGQAAAASMLKPDPEDKNVSPYELAAYARARGFETRLQVSGDIELLQALLSLGIPVLVETWFVPDPNDEMGHYLLLTGFQGSLDDPEGHFLAADSYHGPEVALSYSDFDALWRVFNRVYLLAAPLERMPQVDALLETDAGSEAMWLRSASRARAEIDGGAEDAYAWFNLGASLQALGDSPAAAEAFDRARSLGLPWRLLWYRHAPFEAYAAVGRWADVRALAEANLANAANLEESRYWLGRALAAEGDLEAAREAYERALRDNPGFRPAIEALEADS